MRGVSFNRGAEELIADKGHLSTTRRSMMAVTAATVISGTGSPSTPRAAPADPDAVLVALAERHAATLDACSVTPATTLAGLVAKARIAKLEMPLALDGAQPAPADPAERLARSIIDDLLAMADTA